jgi:hypothetical protein
MPETSVWGSFLTNLYFLAIALDFLGALLIVGFGLWPALQIDNRHYNEDAFRQKRRMCCRGAVIGLILVVAGFALQLVDIAGKFRPSMCC